MTTNRLDQQTAIITGGARGIGFAIATRFLAAGARCALWDRDREAVQAAAHSLGPPDRVQGLAVDITQVEAVEAAALQSAALLGDPHILVNNAGIAGVNKRLWECTPEEWRQVLDLDLFAVFLCCRAIIPQMLKRPYGRIINIASIAGKEGNPNASHYSAAKAGVIGLTKSLGKELAQSGILVNCIAPAVIQTDILKQCTEAHIQYMVSRIPMGRVGQPEEVAALAAWLASQECSFSTGAVFDLSGGRATY